jgi:nicotinate phosphoribosyltransferase
MTNGNLVTDKYQLTMLYGYWLAGIHETPATFEITFRHHPFSGEFTVFGGLDRAIEYVQNFHYSEEEVAYIREHVLPYAKPEFFDYLRGIDGSQVEMWAMDQGRFGSHHVPLLSITGPIGVGQLLETPLLTRVGYASLIATNAARYRLAAGFSRNLIEMGLRRAQGEDGGLTGSEYAYLGGFDSTSNVEAGRRYGVPDRGTVAHSFVEAFSDLSMLRDSDLTGADGRDHDFVSMVLDIRHRLGFADTNEGELAAFIAQAQAFPREFIALVDTYSIRSSGVPNFICVGLALRQIGYQPLGIRIDSGDLGYESILARRALDEHGLKDAEIAATNEITPGVIQDLNRQGCDINTFGVGTNLITCKGDPSLGVVYKLVEFNGESRIKVSGTPEKMIIPRRKQAYRLFDSRGRAVDDLMAAFDAPGPNAGERTICLNPFDELSRAYIVPTQATPLLKCWWKDGKAEQLPSLRDSRQLVMDQLHRWRPDHLRLDGGNPTPYKVSVTPELYEDLRRMWRKNVPIPVID